ncbi:MAG: hypothetical protein ABW049_12075 [Spongiibacteraceae bacterium]
MEYGAGQLSSRVKTGGTDYAFDGHNRLSAAQSVLVQIKISESVMACILFLNWRLTKLLRDFPLLSNGQVFLTGTGAELIPIRGVDGRALAQCPGRVFNEISGAFGTCIERDA